jgi:hypothetical protein
MSTSYPRLSFWEKADLPFAHLSILASVLYHAITGVFRGKASPKRYDHHLMADMIRKLVDRTSDSQKQYGHLSFFDLKLYLPNPAIQI